MRTQVHRLSAGYVAGDEGVVAPLHLHDADVGHVAMVHHIAIVRQDFDRADIRIFFENIRQYHVLVGNESLGLDLVRGAHRDFQVGFTDAPLRGGEGQRRRPACRISGGAVGLDPGQDLVAFVSRHAGRIDEMAVLRVGIPWGHPLIADDFGDHFGVVLHFVVGGQGEWGRRSRMVAALAAVLHDRGHVAVKGGWLLKLGVVRRCDLAAVDRGLLDGDRLTG